MIMLSKTRIERQEEENVKCASMVSAFVLSDRFPYIFLYFSFEFVSVPVEKRNASICGVQVYATLPVRGFILLVF